MGRRRRLLEQAGIVSVKFLHYPLPQPTRSESGFVRMIALPSWLLNCRFVERAAQTMLRRQARQFLVEFDHQDPARSQAKLLRGMVHKAQASEFGRAHDFRRIRTAADFRRLVPLADATQESSDYVSTPQVRETCRRAALTALAFARQQGGILVRLADASLAADVTLDLPRFLRPMVGFGSDNGMSRHATVAVDAIWRPEGPIAILDPRHGLLRLLTNHGVFFEFVATGEIGTARPTRHTVAEIELGVPYVVALSTATTGWARLTDVQVAFTRRDPLLCEQLPSPRTAVHGTPERRTSTMPQPHRRNAGTPAARPEMIVHSPWSTPVDQG